MNENKSFFDSHGHVHFYNKDPYYYLPILKEIEKKIPNRGISVLDVGCGNGSFIRALVMTDVPANIVGFDNSEAMLRMAKKDLKNTNAEIIMADGLNMPIRTDMVFDIVHIDSVLHHLIGKTRSQSRSLVVKMLNILAKKLSNEGSLIVEEVYYDSHIIPSITSFIVFYSLKLLNFLKIDISKKVPEVNLGLEVNFFNRSSLKNLLENYGNVKSVYSKTYGLSRPHRLMLAKDIGHISYVVESIGQKFTQS
jgi:SAM-dependent methyltransferase